jgi:mono/diheme cytochrome c family protein
MGRILGIMMLALAACGGGETSGGDPADAAPTSSEVGDVPPSPQRDGDPQAGLRALLNEGYVGCGVPYTAYEQAFAPAPASLRIATREGRNAELPYNFTSFETKTGVEVVTPNCLQCHADTLRGELVVGLPNSRTDYTQDIGGQAVLAGAFITDPLEREAWEHWRDRVIAISGYTVTRTVGVNPADNLAAVLFAHRDEDTLAWSFEPLLELPPDIVVPVDPPPWWHMRKKHAMFYTAAGRGDHARIMMTASTLCVDTVEDARAIDAYFPDVRAFISQIEPPPYPDSIDTELAATGKLVFEDTCAACHGTYGPGGEYPNTVVAVDEVGTDSVLALGASQFAERFVLWFNNSFFGELAHLAPAPGYIAPPLDGIWATAPYLHNGSVPTVAALLDSSTRPTYWSRNFRDDDLDPVALGLAFTTRDLGHDDVTNAEQRKLIYDTTQLGYGNTGHTYGDLLTAEERRAVIEYLKTL